MKTRKPLVQGDLELRIATALSAISPPRGQPGEIVALDAPAIDYLDAERLLPMLVNRTA